MFALTDYVCVHHDLRAPAKSIRLLQRLQQNPGRRHETSGGYKVCGKTEPMWKKSKST